MVSLASHNLSSNKRLSFIRCSSELDKACSLAASQRPQRSFGMRYSFRHEVTIIGVSLVPITQYIYQCLHQWLVNAFTTSTDASEATSGVNTLTRLVLQWILISGFGYCPFQIPPALKGLLLLFAASVGDDWAICAPAAGRTRGSRFSGSLSGIEPCVARGVRFGSML